MHWYSLIGGKRVYRLLKLVIETVQTVITTKGFTSRSFSLLVSFPESCASDSVFHHNP